MGIVGQNFKKAVIEQINARQKNFSLSDKTSEVIQVQNANSWMRLASSVDIGIPANLPPSRQKDYEDRVSYYKHKFGLIEGSFLAKNLVLTGGTSAYNSEIEALEANIGISTNDSYTFLGAYGYGGVEFGYRPMPAVESAKISYYNNGALARADIEIVCFSAEQLDLLEILFLRPGYTILLEWGHDRYVDNTGKVRSVKDDGTITTTFSQFFANGTKESLQECIATEKQNRSFNYDAFHGMITNFSWTLNNDATYKITLKTITLGAVIESLKISSNSSGTTVPIPEGVNVDDPAESVETTPGAAQSVEANTLQSRIGSRFLESPLLGNLVSISNDLVFNYTFTNNTYQSNPNIAQSTLSGQDTWDGTDIKLILKSFGGNYDKTFCPPFGSITAIPVASRDSKPNKVLGIGELDYLAFVSFDTLLSIVQAVGIIYEAEGKPFVRTEIDLDSSIPMLHFPGRFSADPNVCIIPFDTIISPEVDPNTKKLQLLELDENFSLGKPWIKEYPGLDIAKRQAATPTNFVQVANGVAYNAGDQGFNNGAKLVAPTGEQKIDPFVGYLNSVLVNIEYIISVIDRHTDEAGDVKFIDFFQELLSSINDSLGSINDFQVKYDEKTHIVRIYDLHCHGYLRKQASALFKTYGVESDSKSTIIKSISLTTQLSNEMASMIAIGAQANGNQIGENATAFSEFNAGLYDRIIPTKVVGNTSASPAKSPFEKFQENCAGIYSFVNAIYPFIGTLEVGEYKWGFNLNINNITTLKKLNRDYSRFAIGYFTNQDVQLEAPFIIPFKLSMTIPGLSGVSIFEKYAMDTILLPTSYDNKVDFLILGLTHTINNNKWDTTFDSYTVPRPIGKRAGLPRIPGGVGLFSPTSGGAAAIFPTGLSDYFGDTIEGIGVPGVTTIAENELKIWNNGKVLESSFIGITALERYVKKTPGIPAASYSSDKQPWSGIYVSYIMGEADPVFPGSAAHKNYVNAGTANQFGYRTFVFSQASTANKNVRLQVGDVLVEERIENGKLVGYHGDVIYKIQGDTVYLTGGNLGNSAVSFIRKVPGGLVKPGEKVQSYSSKPYIAIVKKMQVTR